MQVDTILVPTDFSDEAQAALEHALDLAVRLHSRVHLLHACYIAPYGGTHWTPAYPPDLFDRVQSQAEKRIAEVKEKASERGVPIQTEVILGPASIAIVETAERLHADLIVMGTRGLSGLKHVMLGSVTERTLRRAPCPVLTVKGPEANSSD